MMSRRPLPRRSSLLIATAFVATMPAITHAQGDTWAIKAPKSIPVVSPAAGAIDGKLYVAGGSLYNECIPTTVLEVYDPATNTWTTKAPLPEPRHGASAAVINGKLYVLGGTTSGCSDPGNSHVRMYDPGTDTWTAKAPMPTPRAGLGVGVIGDKLYALGGANGGSPVNTFEMYDSVTDTWHAKAPFPTGVSGAVVGVINGKLYAAGGLQVCCTSLATLRVYDPATNTWTSKASLPLGRNEGAGGVIDGILYVSGGFGAAGDADIASINTLFAYDPAADVWTTKAPMPTARFRHAAAIINDQLYVVGGGTATGNLSSLEVYTPAALQERDTTPPDITSTIAGTLGNDGWYTSDVTVSWSVSDAESAFTTSGCDTQTVTSDTNGTTFTCTATSAGGTSSESVTIKRDTAGPVIASATANPAMLWPPNNKMVAVTVSVDASDAGSGLAGCRIDSVNSNEGGSAHEPDVQLTGALTMNLRAERHGSGTGRIYTAYISCTDAAGNTSTATATVTVPHDQGRRR